MYGDYSVHWDPVFPFSEGESPSRPSRRPSPVSSFCSPLISRVLFISLDRSLKVWTPSSLLGSLLSAQMFREGVLPSVPA